MSTNYDYLSFQNGLFRVIYEKKKDVLYLIFMPIRKFWDVKEAWLKNGEAKSSN